MQPNMTLANMGTALMFISVFHLILGNLVIGLCEGALLAKFFHAPIRRSIGAIILANYASAWLGQFTMPVLSRGISAAMGGATLDNIGVRLVTMTLVFFLFTLVVEYAFVRHALGPDARSPSKIMRATFVVNGISYLAMIGIYLFCSNCTLLTGTRRDSSLTWVPRDDRVWVYYIDDATDHLMRVHPDGSERSAVEAKVPAYSVDESRVTWLGGGFLAGHNEGDGSVTLRSSPGPHQATEFTKLEIVYGPILGQTAVGEGRFKDTDRAPDCVGSALTFPGTVLNCDIFAGFWPPEGLVVRERDKPEARVAWDTPFESWAARSATELPNGLIVFAFHSRQIAIYNAETKTIGLLARGRCPVVTIEETHTSE